MIETLYYRYAVSCTFWEIYYSIYLQLMEMALITLQLRHMLNDRKKLCKVIDPDINRGSYTFESIAMFADLASRCIRIDSSQRPTMIDCVRELQKIFYNNSKALGFSSMNLWCMICILYCEVCVLDFYVIKLNSITSGMSCTCKISCLFVDRKQTNGIVSQFIMKFKLRNRVAIALVLHIRASEHC